MKRQAAFIDVKKHLKGALHCHTTRSDGQGTPEDVLALHVQNGYDFVALTDHRYYNYNNYGGAPLTIIPGMEMDASLPGPGTHCHHIVCVGPERDKGNGFEQDQRLDRYVCEKPEDTQAMIDMIHENNNLTVYCHPEWSGTPVCEFEMLKGNFAMELWNSGCVAEFGMDFNNSRYWDELLASGQKIYGVATDDGHAMYHHCNGWVMVNSGHSVGAILDGLKNGAFYASCGPEIHDFYVEDGVAHLNCSPVVEIQFRHQCVPYGTIRAQEGEAGLTEGSTPVKRGYGAGYIRAWVKDAQGRMAWTNPIFLDEDDFAK